MAREIHITPPMSAAAVLERRFGVIASDLRRMALEILVPAIRTGDPQAIERAIFEIEERIEAIRQQELERAAEDAAERANRRHRRLFVAGIAAAVGMKVLGDDENITTIPVPDRPGPGALAAAFGRRRTRGVLVAKLSANPSLLAHQFATQNAAVIKSLSLEVVPALRDEVVRAVQFGIPPEEAAARLERKWLKSGVPIRSGNLQPRVGSIVRDQMTRLNANLTRARAQAAGATEFTWRSQRDSRVRPLHKALDGQKFDFHVGHSTEGEPGDPPNCRCVAVPVVNAEQIVNAPGFIHLAEGESAFELAS